jgi:hypothetical protein
MRRWASIIVPASRGLRSKVGLATDALERLNTLSASWQEVTPSVAVRSLAQRLLRVHALRAADSLQLGDVIVSSENEPALQAFVCLSERLNVAAQREGFSIRF